MVATVEPPAASRVKFLVWKLDQELSAPWQTLPAQVALWFFGIRVLRDYEDEILQANRMPSEESTDHRAILTMLMGAGENLLSKLKLWQECPPQTLKQVQATVDFLRDGYAMWYMPMSEERVSETLNEVFGVQS